MTTRVSIRLHYARRSRFIVPLSLAALVVACMAYLLVGTAAASPSGKHPAGAAVAASREILQYYPTTDAFNGAEAGEPGVCADGYHFASLWEILDPSNLRYDITLGYVRNDSGHGPPTSARGWVRTGYNSDTGTTIGRANCGLWESKSESEYGTSAMLPSAWTASAPRVHVWGVATEVCNNAIPVWCVSDALPISVFLPLVLRSS